MMNTNAYRQHQLKVDPNPLHVQRTRALQALPTSVPYGVDHNGTKIVMHINRTWWVAYDGFFQQLQWSVDLKEALRQKCYNSIRQLITN